MVIVLIIFFIFIVLFITLFIPCLWHFKRHPPGMTTHMRDRQTVVLFGKPGLRPHGFGRVRGGKGCRGPVKEIQQRLSRECWWWRCQNSGRASAVEGVGACCGIRMAMTGPVIAKQRREGTPHGTSAKDSAIGIWMQLGRLVRGFWL